MADLSGVLRKTIDGLPRASPQMREKVYEKARAAIQRQINAANPPLAENIVSARLGALEDAISRTEAHYVAQEAGAAEAADAQADAPVPAAPQTPGQDAAGRGQRPDPQREAGETVQPAPAPPKTAAPARSEPPASDDQRSSETAPAASADKPAPQARPAQPRQNSAVQGSPEGAPPRQMPPMGDPAPARNGPAEGQARPPKKPDAGSQPSAQSSAARTDAAPANGGAAAPRPQQQPAQGRPSLPAATMPGQRSDNGERKAEPFFPPETAEPETGNQPQAIGAPFLVPDERQAHGQPPHAPQALEDDDGGETRIPSDIRIDDSDIPEADVTAPRYPTRRPQRSGSGGKIAAAAAVILLLGGAGTAAWLYRDDIEALLVSPGDIGTIAEQSGTDEQEQPVAGTPSDESQTTETASAESEPASTRRFTQRLLPDGSEVDEGPARKTPNAFDEGTNVAAATNVDPNAPGSGATPTISSEIGQDPAVVGGQNADQEADGQADDAAAPDATSADPQTATNDSASASGGQLEVAQKAVFYQEKTEDLPGTQETGTAVWTLVNQPASEGNPGEPAIQAVVTVPEEKLKLTMTIKRNSDPTLPASHVIELEFEVPQDFSGGSIANVQRLALKETEQARGEPLIGVAGKISDNYFIIALNNLDQAVQNNLSLLENQNWIDIPIAYATGRRALISIEKGIPGDRVFKDALKAWQAKT
ncbi:hypothetical protein [Jiella mangrovi]|uniref:Transcriptional regulator n=1 Tax=Jiella mangrovi TaxID=2821407 RepID=A0ABS4BHC8_9HYPH|nr:hypothetical protein [Jiella mangrovi]MBP0615365.1 hypothetical protein [Jiella mangrovi]